MESRFLEKVPLRDYCTYRTGGPALLFYEPKTIDDIRETFLFSRQSGTPFLVLGKGSNVLIGDKGFDGLVLYTGNTLQRILFLGNKVSVECGVSLSALVRTCCSRGLAGIENLALIPGTIGGAVVMNAGAFDREIGTCVETVVSLTPEGDFRTRSRETCGFAYRESIFKKNNEIIISVTLRLDSGDPDDLIHKAREIEQKRKDKQPWDAACCGSVFKRPPGNYAGSLIEKCGLKGFRLGKARVSEKHANFIINESNATAKNIRNLILYVQKTVLEKTGVFLEIEVIFLGDF